MEYKVEFVVLEEDCNPILGSKAAQQIGLISVCKENIMTLNGREIPLSKDG